MHRVDPRSPGHHRYMIAPGIGAVLAPLPPSAGRSRKNKASFNPPPTPRPATALEDEDAELLFADIWPSPTVMNQHQSHSTQRASIGTVRARAGRRSCEPRFVSDEPLIAATNIVTYRAHPAQHAEATDRTVSSQNTGRFDTPPEERRLQAGRTRGMDIGDTCEFAVETSRLNPWLVLKVALESSEIFAGTGRLAYKSPEAIESAERDAVRDCSQLLGGFLPLSLSLLSRCSHRSHFSPPSPLTLLAFCSRCSLFSRTASVPCHGRAGLSHLSHEFHTE